MRRRGSVNVGKNKGLLALLRTRDGTTALEFGIIAPSYFLVLLLTLEMLFSFYVQNVLDLMVSVVAREISTGNAQIALNTTGTTSNPTSESALLTQVMCPNGTTSSYGVLTCSLLASNVTSVTTGTPPNYYASTTGLMPISGGVINTTSWSVCTGQPGEAMYVQIFYAAPSWLGKLLPSWTVKTSSGISVHPLMAGGGFVNELFTSSGATGC